jgi:drug/metabolite transporter (DMT)-like permease
LATFLLGSSFVAGKILLARGVPATILMGWRFFAAALCTLPFAIAEVRSNFKAFFPPTIRDAAKIAAIGLLQTTAVMGTLLLAMKFIPVSTAALLQYTSPLWLASFSPLLAGKRLQARETVGILFGLSGVALATSIGSEGFVGNALLGDGLALLSAICWVFASIARNRQSPALRPWTLAFWQMLTGATVILALGYSSGERWPTALGLEGWLWFAWLSLPASAGAAGLCFIVLDSGGLRRCSSFLFLAPLFTTLLSFILIDETITVSQIGADLLVGISLWLLSSSGVATTVAPASSPPATVTSRRGASDSDH